MRHTYPTHDEMVVNLLGHYERANDDGEQWYRESRKFARYLARQYGGGLARAAGIIAALSPQVQWHVNKRMAEHVMQDGTPGEGCLGANADKAYRIWMGERPLAVLGGPKVRAFYRAIMGDDDSVVLDTWMATALGWPHNAFSERQYERASAALVDAAGYCNRAPAVFQAIVWTQVRGGAD